MELDSEEIRPLHDTFLSGYTLSVSPDGRFVLTRREDGVLVLFPMDGGPPRPFPELRSQHRAAGWAGDSRSFFVSLVGSIRSSVVRVDVASGSVEPWMEIEPRGRGGVDAISTVRMTRDGERYVCSYSRGDSLLYLAQGLR